MMVYVPAEQRRREFVEAAAHVIAQHGVAGATTRRIAEAAGAPAATLHYCFRNKDELFQELFSQQAQSIADIDGLGTAGEGLAAATSHLMEAILTWYRREPDYARAQLDLLMWSLRQPKYAGLAAQAYDIHVRTYAGVLRHSMASFDDESLIEPLARQIASTADGIAVQWFTYGDDALLESSMRVARESLIALVGQRRLDNAAQPA